MIKKQDFVVTSNMVNALLTIFYTECKRGRTSQIIDMSCLYAAVLIGFCGGLTVDEVFITSLKGMLKIW